MTLNPEPEVLRQLRLTGYMALLTNLCVKEPKSGRHVVYAHAEQALVSLLRDDTERFQSTSFHWLHEDIGGDRVDFRGFRGTFGKGSLQCCISRETWIFYADIDRFSPSQDLVNAIGHAWEVMKGWFS